jgi:hypothetical protein
MKVYIIVKNQNKNTKNPKLNEFHFLGVSVMFGLGGFAMSSPI